MKQARERLLDTAYELFHRNTLNTVGVDRIVAEANVAKTTLYRHFPSKNDLAVSVLRHHEDVWTTGWLERVISHRGGPAGASAHPRPRGGAGADDPDVFALQIQLLLLGSTVAAVSGDRDAARRARSVARLLLEREGIPTES